MPEIEGKNITEVWDFRLSTATPLIVRRENWVAQIWSKENADFDPSDPHTVATPLEEHDTGIPTEQGDHHDVKKVAKCYEWLKTRRDDYAREDIDEIKPLVATINQANAELQQRGAA